MKKPSLVQLPKRAFIASAYSLNACSQCSRVLFTRFIDVCYVALAEQLAGSQGQSSFNETTGSWDITTGSGNTGSSSSTQTGKTNTTTYTSEGNDGENKTSSTSYDQDSIHTYYDAGGTKDKVKESYNHAAYGVADDDWNYEETADIVGTTAAAEASVAKELLGLTDAETKELENALTKEKTKFDTAEREYKKAMETGDTATAAKKKAEMDAAHSAAAQIRSEYGYAGDDYGYEDGGFYLGGNTGGSRSRCRRRFRRDRGWRLPW